MDKHSDQHTPRASRREPDGRGATQGEVNPRRESLSRSRAPQVLVLRTRIRSIGLLIALLAVLLAARIWPYDLAFVVYALVAGVILGRVMLSVSFSATRFVARIASTTSLDVQLDRGSHSSSSPSKEPVFAFPPNGETGAFAGVAGPLWRSLPGRLIVLAWTCAEVSGPAWNVTVNRLLARTVGGHTDACMDFFVKMFILSLAASVFCLFSGLYMLNRPYFHRLEAAILSAGLVGLHVVVFLLSTLAL
jgi:hypothetical protein